MLDVVDVGGVVLDVVDVGGVVLDVVEVGGVVLLVVVERIAMMVVLVVVDSDCVDCVELPSIEGEQPAITNSQTANLRRRNEGTWQLSSSVAQI